MKPDRGRRAISADRFFVGPKAMAIDTPRKCGKHVYPRDAQASRDRSQGNGYRSL